MKKSEKQENYWFDFKSNIWGSGNRFFYTKPPLEKGLFLKTAQGYAKLMNALVYSPENLLIHLSNKLAQIKRAQLNEESFTGRISNRFFVDNPHVVTLDGIVVTQLYETIEEEPPFEIQIQAIYDVDYDSFLGLYNKAHKVITAFQAKARAKAKETALLNGSDKTPSVKRR